MPTISEIVKLYGLSARQSLSQNFILDQNLLGRVVRSCGVLEGATVLEVGAGPGNLTRALLQVKWVFYKKFC
jgi:16S rRNA (adenine1518-N6/adenine1519-N6)-dimethyltransferase